MVSKPVTVHIVCIVRRLALLSFLVFRFVLFIVSVRFLEAFMGLHQKHHSVKTGGAALVGEGFSRVLIS